MEDVSKWKEDEVKLLIDKAAQAEKSEDGLRFSQAACNSANAMCALKVALAATLNEMAA